METKDFGKQGEDKATDFLKGLGYEILQRNYRKRSGEIDIIAFDPKRKEYVFAEVKSRRNRTFGAPEEAVSERKVQKMADTAQHWLAEQDKEKVEWRLDLVILEIDLDGNPEWRHLTHLG
jgi:putative endonuclease